MTKVEIQKRLREDSDYLRNQFGVSRIGVFGSYARDQARTESDIDLLVEFSRPIGWEIVDLQI